MVDKILTKASPEVVHLAWHLRLWTSIAQQDKTIHASPKGFLVMCSLAWQDTHRRGRDIGVFKAQLCEKWNDYKQGMEKKCYPVSLKYNLNNIEWGQKEQ